MHSSYTIRKPVDVLVDELYDTRDILDETRRLTAVDRVIETLRKTGEVEDLPPARKAVIAQRAGYSSVSGPNGLQVWIPHIARNKCPGEWLDFYDWFSQVDKCRTESAREALQAVKTHGLDSIGLTPPNFGPHLRYGLHAGLFTQEDVDAARERYEASHRK